MKPTKHIACFYRILPRLLSSSLLACILTCTPLYTMEHIHDQEPRTLATCIQNSDNSNSQEAPAVYKNGKKVYPCNLCGKIFSAPNKLAAHIRTHTGEKPFVCTICGLGFAQNGGLTRHIKKHTREKGFVCEICEQVFARKDVLEQHRQTHTKEKKFACAICKKNYSRQEHLTIHMHSHTGSKPYACTQCDKTFGNPGSLRTHTKKHTGQHWYICDYPKCTYKTPQKTHLNRHMQIHLKENSANDAALPIDTTPEGTALNTYRHPKKRTILKHGLSMPPMVEDSAAIKKQHILRDDPVLQENMEDNYENPDIDSLNAQEMPEMQSCPVSIAAAIAQNMFAAYEQDIDILEK